MGWPKKKTLLLFQAWPSSYQNIFPFFIVDDDYNLKNLEIVSSLLENWDSFDDKDASWGNAVGAAINKCSIYDDHYSSFVCCCICCYAIILMLILIQVGN